MAIEETLEPHLGRNEQILEFHSGKQKSGLSDRVIAITNQRLIRFHQDVRTVGRDSEEIETTLLHGPHILGTSANIRGETTADQDELLIGGGSALLGVLIYFFGILESVAVLLLTGIFFVVLGGFLIFDGLQTEAGDIELTIQTTNGDETVELPQEAESVAAKASEVVASANN